MNRMVRYEPFYELLHEAQWHLIKIGLVERIVQAGFYGL